MLVVNSGVHHESVHLSPPDDSFNSKCANCCEIVFSSVPFMLNKILGRHNLTLVKR